MAVNSNIPLIYLVYPDAAVSRALAASLGSVWPGLRCEATAADALPSPLPSDALLFIPQTPPVRFKTMVQQLHQMLRKAVWPGWLDFANAALDTRNRAWQSGEASVTLTEKEVALLVYLWQRKIPASREDLLRDVWEYAADVDTHTIETHIYRLRQKIEPDPGNPRFLLTTKDGYQLAGLSIPSEK